ncbi:MAG: MarR family transcriptional regulator [Sneathiella sp.]|jgi:DNA-binding MarR family transcriptional regulator|uniref:MarR family winged helix-turn-helix transcriptional regulator n=1 Tax=Sneathiella sp. TaxID=1964365 RepID=UPI000C3F0759|nr:MarR family winged helix-turn-helix transcriptional regulator [Sneathiella sp.]MAL80479.1 MarR family transcriptional regulator [Sneathiella sp.]|tara:strand:+ start:286 stop:759 length:474 start_codon:yes stop_codon:yes gene_type:complete
MTHVLPLKPEQPEQSVGRSIDDYHVEVHIGHLLRRAHQRASAIFQSHMGYEQITPTQFAALTKLRDEGELSQNHLGRLTAMDPATIQGVIRRLIDRGLIETRPDESDRRRMLLRLTEEGQRMTAQLIPHGFDITDDTLEPLTEDEKEEIVRLLRKIS